MLTGGVISPHSLSKLILFHSSCFSVSCDPARAWVLKLQFPSFPTETSSSLRDKSWTGGPRSISQFDVLPTVTQLTCQPVKGETSVTGTKGRPTIAARVYGYDLTTGEIRSTLPAVK